SVPLWPFVSVIALAATRRMGLLVFSQWGNRTLGRPCRISFALLVLSLEIAGLGLGGRVQAGEFLDDRFGHRTVPIMLLMRPDVQTDLKLEPDQVALARRAAAELYYKAMALRGQSGPALEAARRAIDGEESVWLSRHLSEPQFERLRQIDLQWEGVAAMLTRPVIADHLNLTAEQKRTLGRYVVQQRQSRKGQSGYTPADQAKLARQAMTVLTDNQRQLWYSLLGPTCRFAIGAHSTASPENTASAPGYSADASTARGVR
ncbi:MAG TPA: hypothetical protein VKA15_06500, partial [Isosphaeraceae bacterium]|nr:hypothetical protein [Isosphaeraceae bacterium]